MCTEEEEAFDANEHVEPFADRSDLSERPEDIKLRAVASEGAVHDGASRESWRGMLGGG